VGLLTGGALSPGGYAVGATGVPWLPTMESSLRLWIDPSDTTGWTLDGSGNPTAMRSKASTLDIFTLAAGSVPALTSGRLTVSSTATLFSTSSNLGLSTDPDLSIVLVGAPSVSGGGSAILRVGSGASGSPVFSFSSTEYAWRYSGAGNSVFPSVNGSGQVLLSARRLPGTDKSTAIVRADGSNVTITSFVNGTTNVSDSVSTLFIFYTGTLDEIIAFSSTNQALVERTEGFLAHKRGRVAQLPSNHPFKLAPPTVPA
jgi:hypothetical protein